ncbi:MAG TPA: hypothetical protein DEP42_06215 [Ruminococcaceae bacterium]|nr:hypothetical protein [Oscillospiraceae bacterium]
MAKRTVRPGCAGFLTAIAVVAIGAGVFFYSIYNKRNATTPTTSSASSSSTASTASTTSTANSETKAGGLLAVVNADNPLPSDFSPTLTTVASSNYLAATADEEIKKLDTRAAPQVEKMIKAAHDDGVDLFIVHGYKSVETDRTAFKNKVKQYRTKGYSASKASSRATEALGEPGTTEDETGLSVDMETETFYKQVGGLRQSFSQTDAYAWLVKNAPEYGFILRYPKSKVSVTGVEYEPYHWRYVGTDNARKIEQSGKCLEQYAKS